MLKTMESCMREPSQCSTAEERINSCSGSTSSSDSAQCSKQKKESSAKPELVQSCRQPSSQFKGVVPQHNGKWGAQIYAKHQRVWLGTFNTQAEAALAYDRASLKFRSAEGPRNFLNAEHCQAEICFQDLHTKEEVVQMIKDHSYDEKLACLTMMGSRITATEGHDHGRGFEITLNVDEHLMVKEHLFDKEVTPSDVGKLNRLVIPKQHAERYFPLDSQMNDKDVFLTFEDNNNKHWVFRYSFWKSSQSYVLTRGWSKFVKEKQLDAGDIVSFARRKTINMLYISVFYRPNSLKRMRRDCYPQVGSSNIVERENIAKAMYNHVLWGLGPNVGMPIDDCHKSFENPSALHNQILLESIQLGDDANVLKDKQAESNSTTREKVELNLFPKHRLPSHVVDEGLELGGHYGSSSSQTQHGPTNENPPTSVRLFGVEIGTKLEDSHSQ